MGKRRNLRLAKSPLLQSSNCVFWFLIKRHKESYTNTNTYTNYFNCYMYLLQRKIMLLFVSV
nr:MAG TPA: hypothetical protein [Caudoviricetes sp.]